MSSTTILVVLCLVVLILIHANGTHLRHFPRDTIINMVHHIIIRSNRIVHIADPFYAMIEARETQASLGTIIDVVGGLESLSTVCDLNIEHLRNTLQLQERQLYTMLRQ